MKYIFFITAFSFILFTAWQPLEAQVSKNMVYIDQQGRMRWTKDGTEVYLFGVNYTVPFAYGYRSMQALNKSVEKEIDEDTYHMARMGVDAFRVHIWDSEISDSAGNLIDNDHLKMFDYLLYRLKQRNIRIIITMIAFYGDGYPQQDQPSGGFSIKYGKANAGLNEVEIKAQENYIRQLLQHVNPYTKINYRDEPDIIGAELNNEPSHSGPKAAVTAYINRLAAAARGTGWTKPLFYNISQNPFYADAVAKSTVNGFSFQWYPTGLVAGHEQKGNFLPNVDRYVFPFDTIPEFEHKARMVYEFDAADVLQSCMYPAVARSFKQAGFQWITQFAYDPIGTAYGNTEYQTHYLNLAYTPAKAISYLIASREFLLLPREKNYGTYPADSVFDAYHVSYAEAISEMNTPKEFYYSGNTPSQPVAAGKLEHIAGVGSSAVVHYQGYGAYFMDKLENGVWRLEVMPDAITIRDPFAKPSPEREVVHIQWENETMQISLADLGNDFTIRAINSGNSYMTTSGNGLFTIKPGTYLLVKKGRSGAKWTSDKMVGNIGLNEFIAPQPYSKELYITYLPPAEISTGTAFNVDTKIINIDSADKVTLIVNRSFGPPAMIPMERTSPYDYHATVPAVQVTTGILTYRILIKHGNETIAFPGGHSGDPAAWDYLNADYWQTFVAATGGKLSLFNATTDRERLNPYFPGFSRNGGARFVSGEETGELAFSVATPALRKNQVLGMQLYVGNKLKCRLPEAEGYNQVLVRARRQSGGSGKLTIALLTSDAAAYSATIDLNNQYTTTAIPLSAFKPDSSLLLPRPYPGFLPLWFRAGSFSGLNVSKLDKLEITAGNDLTTDAYNKPFGIEVESVTLEP